MFLNITNKIYFINKSANPNAMNGISIVDYNNYIDEKLENPTLEILYKSLYKKYVKNKSYTLLVMSDDIWKTAFEDFISYMNLDEKAISLILEHSQLSSKIWDNCDEILGSDKNKIIKNINYVNIYKKKIDLSIFPAEYAINHINEEWAKNKYEFFRMYEFYDVIKRYQFDLYRKGFTDDYLNELFKYGDQCIKNIWNNKELKTKIINKYKNKINIGFLEMPIEEYVISNSTFGYNQYNAWKYNWKLAKYLRKINYKIK